MMTHILRELKGFLAHSDVDWAVAGGNAIDIFARKQTRDHKDINISVFYNDKKKIIDYMLKKEWRVFVPDRNILKEITVGGMDFNCGENIWCLTPDNKYYDVSCVGENLYKITNKHSCQKKLDFIEVLFNISQDGAFVCNKEKSICLEMKRAVLDFDLAPYLAPEIVLLYKAAHVKKVFSVQYEDNLVVNKYRHDFNVACREMVKSQKDWLLEALKMLYPCGHDWIDKLELNK